jgi:eukaryotic-like serine/threonine-protein kinase
VDTPISDGILYRYRFGGVELDEARFEVTVGGLPVELELKPFQVLLTLCRHRGEVVSREQLFASVWTARVTVDQVLTNAIVKLRKALGATDGARIATIPRQGYRIEGPVERIAVATRLTSRLELRVGEPVPGRPNFLLHARLPSSAGTEVWLARHQRAGELRVYKFAQDAQNLGALKREATLYQLLRAALGDRDDLSRIMDWNFDTPPFFLECEYGGESLLEWAESRDRLAALPLAQRLDLFLRIADTVSAAHRVGVLHKDLKPSNVLIEERPNNILRVRVADFGSGWLMEPNRLEELGITQLGMTSSPNVASDSGTSTPLYVAPELVGAGSPTVQSDLFALGLILYQVVIANLRKPMASGWEHEIDDELLVADIKAATDGDPARRLESVAALTQRLRQLEARRETREAQRVTGARAALAEQALERARIQRPWVVAAACALLLGLLASLLLYRNERQARSDAEKAAARAELAARQNEAVNRFVADDLLGAADLSGPGGAHNPTMREVLGRAADTLNTRFGDQPAVKGALELALGNAYFGLTDYALAEKHRRAAVELLSASEGPGSDGALEARYQLISILAQTNRLDEAAALLDQADQETGPRRLQSSRLAFQAHWTRGGYYKVRMATQKALEEYLVADRIRTAIDPDNALLLVRLRDALSWCYVRLERAADAERVLRDVMTPAYSPQRVGPLYWAVARIDYGQALKSLGQQDTAEQVMKTALQELRSALGQDHFFVAVAQNELSDLYMRQGRWPEAVESLREAYRVFRDRTGEHGQATLIVGANLGIVQYRMGKFTDAVQSLEPIHTEFVRTLGVSSPQAQSVAFYLASAYCDKGQPAAAARLAASLNSTDLASAEPRDDWTPRLAALRGRILVAQGLRAEGVALLAPAVAEMKRSKTPDEDLGPFERALAAAR